MKVHQKGQVSRSSKHGSSADRHHANRAAVLQCSSCVSSIAGHSRQCSKLSFTCVAQEQVCEIHARQAVGGEQDICFHAKYVRGACVCKPDQDEVGEAA